MIIVACISLAWFVLGLLSSCVLYGDFHKRGVQIDIQEISTLCIIVGLCAGPFGFSSIFRHGNKIKFKIPFTK